ncbi:MAG: transposase [Ktedonobacteraceae bacterium]|nr:transposase [Ktedonobacteraceae bacterium]
MQLPIVTPAPVVVAHAGVFRSLFDNKRQFRHFENYLTGLMVLSNKSMANICRCTAQSADKTNLSRFLSEAPWLQEQINDRRVEYLLEQTQPYRFEVKKSCLILDDTLCEHVGSLFEYIDRHYHHAEDRYPLAHNLVTSHYVSGAVRFPVDMRLYRRYEEITHWEEFVKKRFPERFTEGLAKNALPTRKKERQQLHKELDTYLLQDSEFRALHEQFQTKITLSIELLNKAIERKLPFQVVLMDAWYLSEELVALLHEHHLDWVSLLKKNRNLEVASFTLKDADGEITPLCGPHIQVQELVPLIPASAYQKITVEGRDYFCFSLNVCVPKLAKVRLVISFDNPELSGTCAVLLSNRTDWSAKKIIETYLQRWPIETFYQDSKGHLGLDEYRMRTAEAIQKHWCLVFVAYSLLHLDCLPASPAEDKKGAMKTTSTLSRPIKTIGEACRQQGQALIEALILFAHQRLQQGDPANELFAKLFTKQYPVLIPMQ